MSCGEPGQMLCPGQSQCTNKSNSAVGSICVGPPVQMIAYGKPCGSAAPGQCDYGLTCNTNSNTCDCAGPGGSCDGTAKVCAGSWQYDSSSLPVQYTGVVFSTKPSKEFQSSNTVDDCVTSCLSDPTVNHIMFSANDKKCSCYNENDLGCASVAPSTSVLTHRFTADYAFPSNLALCS